MNKKKKKGPEEEQELEEVSWPVSKFLVHGPSGQGQGGLMSCPGGNWGPDALSGPGDNALIRAGLKPALALLPLTRAPES